jgi:hypothetical protein
VLIVGFGLVLALVTAAAALPVGRQIRLGHRRRRDLVVPPTSLRPPLASGIGMALNGGRDGRGLPLGTALAMVALTVWA